jgi:hypothetical protein
MTQVLIHGSATTGFQPPTFHTSADDPATRAWERGAHVVPREALLTEAREKLSRLLGLPSGWDGHTGQALAPVAAMAMNGVLTELVRDDGPTPQLAPLPDGGIQVEWLVAGISLRIDVDTMGDVSVTGDEPGNAELFADEFPYWEPDYWVLDKCQTLLEKMAGFVEKRLMY